MKTVKWMVFKVEWILNSFRQIDFKTYHKTYLVPTKWNILGMLTSVCGENEKFYYDLVNKKIDVQIKILNIWWFTKDLWHIKNLKHKEWSIIRRERIYNPIYEIEIIIEDEKLLWKFLDWLKNPKRIPSLWLNDEIVKIFDIKIKNFVLEEVKEIDKIIFMKEVKDFSFNPFKGYFFQAPKLNRINESWEVSWNKEWLFDTEKRSIRKPVGNLYFIDFYNWIVKFEENIQIWKVIKKQ